MKCNYLINSIDKTFCQLTNGFQINKDYFNSYFNTYFNTYLKFIYSNADNHDNHDIIINNNNLMELFNYYTTSYYNSYNFLSIMCLVFFYDNLLLYLFGNKSRWFQLHSLINLIITINIFPEFFNISDKITMPYLKLTPIIKSYNSSFYIIALHVYHLLNFTKLTFYDYFHHILFVFCGVLPCFLYLETNQYVMAYIACAGIPGIFEYGSLSLYKNEKITLLTQKRINSYLYIYFRYPLCIFGITINFIKYKLNLLEDNLFMTIYLNFLLFFNGSLFSFLTLDSYCRLKYFKKHNISSSTKIDKYE